MSSVSQSQIVIICLVHQQTCDFAVQIMLVVGGQAPKAIRSLEIYDFKSEKWTHAADMPARRCRSGLYVCLSVCNQLLLFALCRARFVVDLEGSTSPGQMVEPPTEKSEIQVGVCK